MISQPRHLSNTPSNKTCSRSSNNYFCNLNNNTSPNNTSPNSNIRLNSNSNKNSSSKQQRLEIASCVSTLARTPHKRPETTFTSTTSPTTTLHTTSTPRSQKLENVAVPLEPYPTPPIFPQLFPTPPIFPQLLLPPQTFPLISPLTSPSQQTLFSLIPSQQTPSSATPYTPHLFKHFLILPTLLNISTLLNASTPLLIFFLFPLFLPLLLLLHLLLSHLQPWEKHGGMAGIGVSVGLIRGQGVIRSNKAVVLATVVTSHVAMLRELKIN